jgi:hypothetical protein
VCARLRGDTGDIVIGWLTKIALLLAVAAIVVFNAVSIASARFDTATDANSAAAAASQAWVTSNNVQLAFQAAQAAIAQNNSHETILRQGFVIEPDGTVHLRMRRVAVTLLLQDLGPLARLADVTVSGTGRYLPGT